MPSRKMYCTCILKNIKRLPFILRIGITRGGPGLQVFEIPKPGLRISTGERVARARVCTCVWRVRLSARVWRMRCRIHSGQLNCHAEDVWQRQGQGC